jgi:DNA adenine methylase
MQQSFLPAVEIEQPLPAPLHPPLKWAGGKRWLVPHLKALWLPQQHRRLLEPFCGGLAVTLGLQPRRALIADINEHLVNFYCWLQRGLTIEIEMRNDEELYYAHRKRFNQLIHERCADSKESAALFYYLNRSGYNGLCRFNKRGEFNVPFGSYKTINYTFDFTPYKSVLADWTFVNSDFQALNLEADDFIYADPPYDVEFVQYSKGGFSWEDQVRLARWLADHPGPVVISNQATDRITKLYTSLGFSLEYLEAPRNINSDGKNRKKTLEVLATRNLAPILEYF